MLELPTHLLLHEMLHIDLLLSVSGEGELQVTQRYILDKVSELLAIQKVLLAATAAKVKSCRAKFPLVTLTALPPEKICTFRNADAE